MSWLRSLWRGAEDDDPDPADQFELALEKPERHVRALLDVAQQPEDVRYSQAAERLETWPPRLWFRLDGARLDEWYGAQLAPPRGWSAVIDESGAPVLLLVLASTHPDGFLREAATRSLAARDEGLAAAALAVRAFDHVSQVRDAARAALLARPPERDALIAVPILLAGQSRQTAGGLLERYVAQLSPETVKALVVSSDRDTRRFSVPRAPLSLSELVRVAASDQDTHVRLDAAARALVQDPSIATALLEVRPASVRALALASAAESVVSERLDRLLLDRRALLRRAAQIHARAKGYDVRSLYLENLPRRTAVLGLGETGEPSDADLLIPLVDNAQAPPVRRAAIVGLGRLAPPEVRQRLLPEVVHDEEPAVAREAGRQLRRLGFTFRGSELDRAFGAPHVWTRQAALGMALGVRGWDVPVAALALYEDEDESLRTYARATLQDWLARRAATAGSPSVEQRERLQSALGRLALDEHLARTLRFHAGARG